MTNTDFQKKLQSKLASMQKIRSVERTGMYKNHLEKVRPAFKKLVYELKAAHLEIQTLKKQISSECSQEKEEELKKQFQEEEKLKVEQIEHLLKTRSFLEVELQELKGQASEKENALTKELNRLEEDRQRLVERLADTLSQMQRQSEIVKEVYHLREMVEKNGEEKKSLLEEFAASDIAKLKKECEEKDRAHEENLHVAYQKLQELSQKNGALTEDHLQLRAQLHTSREQVRKLENDKMSLHQLVKNLKTKCQENEAEAQKATTHLGKKVKEVTLLSDLLEKQQNEFSDLKTAFFELQKQEALLKDEKETLLKQVQEKEEALALQAKIEEEKLFLIQEMHQKTQKNYDELHEKFLALKQFLNNV